MDIRRVPPGLLITVLVALFCCADVMAAAYKYCYVDAKGEAHFADKPELVPEPYRAAAVIVSVEEIDEKAQAAAEEERSRAAAAVVRTEAAGTVAEAPRPSLDQLPDAGTARPFQVMSLVWSGAAVLSVFVIMTVLGWIDVLRERENILNGIRTGLFVLLAVYLVFAHGRDVIGLFSKVGSSISKIEQQSAERGKKAAQFYKTLENLAEQTEKMQKDQESQIKELQEQN
ncbi:MAG: ion transporter [Nitrospirota bacterium]|nr:ion transporter [Nitrospirota bacterium]